MDDGQAGRPDLPFQRQPAASHLPPDRRLLYLIDYLQEALERYVREYPDTTRGQVVAALRRLRNGVEWQAGLEQHLQRAVEDYQEQYPAAGDDLIVAGLRGYADLLADRSGPG